MVEILQAQSNNVKTKQKHWYKEIMTKQEPFKYLLKQHKCFQA